MVCFSCAGILNIGHVIEWELNTVLGTYRVNPLAEDAYVSFPGGTRVRVWENSLFVAYRLAGVLPMVNFAVVSFAAMLLSMSTNKRRPAFGQNEQASPALEQGACPPGLPQAPA